MQAIYIILGLVLVVSFVIGFIKTILENRRRKRSVADNPKIVFDIKEDNKKDKDNDLELL